MNDDLLKIYADYEPNVDDIKPAKTDEKNTVVKLSFENLKVTNLEVNGKPCWFRKITINNETNTDVIGDKHMTIFYIEKGKEDDGEKCVVIDNSALVGKREEHSFQTDGIVTFPKWKSGISKDIVS